jgi:predicted transcriptional regulator
MLREVSALKDMKLKHLRSLIVLYFVHKHPGSSILEVAKGLGISYKTAQRYLRELRGEGRLLVRLDKNNTQRFYANISVKLSSALMDFEDVITNVLEEKR